MTRKPTGDVGSPEKAEQVIEEIERNGVRSFAVKADRAGAEQVAHLVRSTHERSGKLDILANNTTNPPRARAWSDHAHPDSMVRRPGSRPDVDAPPVVGRQQTRPHRGHSRLHGIVRRPRDFPRPTAALKIVAGVPLLTGPWIRPMTLLLLAGFRLITAFIVRTAIIDQFRWLLLLKNLRMAGGFVPPAKTGASGPSVDGLLSSHERAQ